MSARLEDAAALAIRDFHGVTRKGSGAPYITHLFGVASIVGEHGGTEDEMIAALLHDWLEDIDGATRSALEARFGAHVAEIVVGCSDAFSRPKPPWEDRKSQHIAQLRTATTSIRRVSAADKIHNGRAILRDVHLRGDAAFDIFNAPKDRVLWYYGATRDALADGWSDPLLDLLTDVVDALELAAI